jgi:hypothetical protein
LTDVKISFFSFFSLAAAVLFGFMAGTLCNFATQLKFLAGYDDALDVSFFSVLPLFDYFGLSNSRGSTVPRTKLPSAHLRAMGGVFD